MEVVLLALEPPAQLGVYSVVSYSVSRRTQELGVRVALGARRAGITRLVLGEGLLLASAGIVIGLAAGVALTRLMKSLLFEVTATDPLTRATVSCLVLLVTAAAAFIPARRAAAIDPVTALRYEYRSRAATSTTGSRRSLSPTPRLP